MLRLKKKESCEQNWTTEHEINCDSENLFTKSTSARNNLIVNKIALSAESFAFENIVPFFQFL